MQCGNITIADSFYNMLTRESESSVCIRILVRGLRNLAMGRPTRLISSDLPGNYFSFREKTGMISFCPKGKEQLMANDGTWRREGRQSCRPGKWLRSMLNPRISSRIQDHLYAHFATVVKHEELKGQLKFIMTTIREAYRPSNFMSTDDDECAIDSCMWGDPVGEFYDKFNVRAVVAVNGEGEWVGRALVWSKVFVGNTLSHPDLFEKDTGLREITLMDRVYAINEETAHGMLEHAASNGWWRKQKQNNEPSGPFILPSGKEVMDPPLTVFGDSADELNFYPYLDTFQYGGRDWLSNQYNYGGRGALYDYQADSGGGDRHDVEEDHDGQVQDVDGEWIEEDDAQLVNGRYYRSDDHRIVRCERDQEYVLREDAYIIRLSSHETICLSRCYVSEG